MTGDDAVAFVREHGIVLASAKGRVPRLTDVIAGAPIAGSWWAHPEGRQIFAILRAVETSPDVLVCRLVDGKITFVHRRLWPALVRLAPRFATARLARVQQRHTSSGAHVNDVQPFPDWVPPEVAAAAQRMTTAAAEQQLRAVAGPDPA